MSGTTVLDVSHPQQNHTQARALVQRAKCITEQELATYRRRTRKSQEANLRAWKSLPSGVASSFQ